MPTIRTIGGGGGGGGLGPGTKVTEFNDLYDIRGPQATVGNTNVESDLVNVTITANSIPVNGCLRWWALIQTNNSVVNNQLNIRVYFGGTILANHGYGVTQNGAVDYAHWGWIQNLNAAGTQEAYSETIRTSDTKGIYNGGNIGAPSPNSWQAAWFKMTKDTTVDQIWKITIDWVNAPGVDPSARSLVSYLEILK